LLGITAPRGAAAAAGYAFAAYCAGGLMITVAIAQWLLTGKG
jgi:hypothetical protein